jgi:SAM-dependent methyltransferase
MKLRALRRDRAARRGPELFLLERAFDDCLDRLSLVRRRFERGLLIGCPDPQWPERLREFADEIDVVDPSPLLASAAGGEQIVEDDWQPANDLYDLVLAVGTLDTINDLSRALLAIRWTLQPQGLFVGALSGGDTLPQLRAAMRAADVASGAAAPHVHPRIEASALAQLLAQVGFAEPVVDVDRAAVSYRSFARLIDDLRRMGATNILTQRPRRPLTKRALAAASENFAASAEEERTMEIFEILHFACWSPAE